MDTLRIDGSSFFIAGRFERLPTSRIERALALRGGTRHRRLTRRTDFVVVTHEAAGRIASPGLEAALERDARHRLSEETFLRALGLAAPSSGKDIDDTSFRGLAGLAPEDIGLLSLFDVLTPEGGRFAFGDLRIAQHVAALRRRGVSIASVLEAATRLRRRRRGADSQEIVRLDVGPGGELMMRIGDALAEFDGQIRFAWSEPAADPDALFAAAEQAADRGELAAAERLYGACLRASPRDPVLRFNLGNTVRDLGRLAEAKAHYLAALAAEPGFAEAHFNLGHLAHAAGDRAAAVAHFERAVLADPAFADPLYNLAILYIQADRVPDAAPLLERYVRLDPASVWGREARKLLLACRAALAPARLPANAPASCRAPS
jgi:tetratricopeptide (TPR) repeat protein